VHGEGPKSFLFDWFLSKVGRLAAVLWLIAKEAAAGWSNHKDSRQGAALAYYSVFSLGPIIVIAIAVAGFFFGSQSCNWPGRKLHHGFARRYRRQSGASDARRRRAATRGDDCFAAGPGRPALRGYWRCRPAERHLKYCVGSRATPGHGSWRFIRSYVFSLAAVLALGFLLLVSLTVTTGLAAFSKYAAAHRRMLLHLISSLV
jgi:membrane protein